MAGSERMSNVDRKQKERIIEAQGAERGALEILQDYTNDKYPLMYSFNPIPWLKQFYLWAEVQARKLVLSETPFDLPTVYSETLTESNSFENKNSNQIRVYNGTKWIKPKGIRTGLKPDIQLINIQTRRPFLYECKNQQAAGNTHERGCKYLTPPVAKVVQWKMNIDYFPFGFIITGGMSRDPNYIREWKTWTGDHPTHLVVWDDQPQPNKIIKHFETVVRPLID